MTTKVDPRAVKIFQMILVKRCLLSVNRTILRHLKLEITSAIPDIKARKIEKMSYTKAQGLIKVNTFIISRGNTLMYTYVLVNLVVEITFGKSGQLDHITNVRQN